MTKRHLRMTEADKIRKINRQRTRRLEKPAINGAIRKLFNTPEEYYELYRELFKLQAGLCAICKKSSGQRRFHMDHDHKTLEIRGLLCFSCNSKLGFVEKYFGEIMYYLGYEIC